MHDRRYRLFVAFFLSFGLNLLDLDLAGLLGLLGWRRRFVCAGGGLAGAGGGLAGAVVVVVVVVCCFTLLAP